jgi:hypothetical protein
LTYNFKEDHHCKAVLAISSSLKYRINEKDYDVEDYKSLGIILGGKSDGSQTFVTAAPDIPEIILRDPPGSNSFASIEKESISFTTESSLANAAGNNDDLEILLAKFYSRWRMGPIIEAETTNSIAWY